MAAMDWIPAQAEKSLKRLLPRIQDAYGDRINTQWERWEGFERRLHREWPTLFQYLYDLYGWQYDFFFTLEQVLFTIVKNWLDRPEELKLLDTRRLENPDWFLSEKIIGGVLYVDLFSDNLAKLPEHIPYFKKLGITYLHLMPLFAIPHGNNDGGYAVSDYRMVNPDIGTMEELVQLVRQLREEGISLVLDFVFNHTSDEHGWAIGAKAGIPEYQDFYHIFDDRTLPDQYQQHLRDIFPTVRKGSFTWCAEMNKWVWTTFNSFQWDLNYANPEVFRAMADEMLFLANHGIEILRLDAVAFIWKKLGTTCENLPEAHTIIRAFNTISRIAAPALLFKSEAIVHPDEIVKYMSPDECHLSYNPLLMALLWEALATRNVRFLKKAIDRHGSNPEGSCWVNYLRCHDDIGWTFDDNEARAVGVDPAAHRRFLNDFYTGRYPGSFAMGLPFQYNPENGDLRISGTLASLAGLEQALTADDSELMEMAVLRINLLRSMMLSVGGIPLIYLGDEWGMLNDYTFLSDPAKAEDTRWVHRSRKRWAAGNDVTDPDAMEWRFFNELVRLIEIRKQNQAFGRGDMQLLETDNAHILAFARQYNRQRVLVVNNFSDKPQVWQHQYLKAFGKGRPCRDLISEETVDGSADLTLTPYAFRWLAAVDGL